MVWPRATAVIEVAPEVPRPLADEYREAWAVLPHSPKASAALSRRCLQNLLENHLNIPHDDLSKQIDKLLARKELPSHLSEEVDAIRNVGNFAAHPMKCVNTGELYDVEPNEAETSLGTIEGLFDFYFVESARRAQRKAALNQKLAQAGQKPLKEPKP